MNVLSSPAAADILSDGRREQARALDGGEPMGTGITLRWQLAPFACEFHLDGGQGLLLLRAGAEIIARETVASARMAYDRAADLVDALRRRDENREMRSTRARG